jgi:hypothetical protein
MAISRMQEPRQLYGLGSIVKKAVRGVKKIAKSPIGKAAIGGALMFGLPGTSIGGLFGRAGFGGAATGLLGQQGIGATLSAAKAGLANRFAPNFVMNRSGPVKGGGFFSSLNPFGGNFSGKNAFLTAGALATAAPFIADAMAPEEVEEEVDVMDVESIRQSARDYYMGTGGKGLAFMPQKQYVQSNFYQPNANGGRVGYANGMMVEDEEEEFIRSAAGMSRRQPKAFLSMGGGAGNAQAEQMLMAEFVKYKNKGGTLSFEQFVKAVMQQQQAPEGAGMEQPEPVMMAANGGPVPDSTVAGYTTPAGYNKFDYRSGGVPVRVGAQEGGIMETEEASEMIDMGGMEKDFRNEGGFVAMGGKERADDVPARLSKNEFVFTADAVRNAGGGDIDKGAEVMENLMNNLEQGGEVSEDSQGLDGAQAMYDQQQMLQSRMI